MNIMHVREGHSLKDSMLGQEIVRLVRDFNPRVILDVGAATGLGSTTVFAEAVLEAGIQTCIYAIEAQAETYVKLVENMAAYSFVTPVHGCIPHPRSLPAWPKIRADILRMNAQLFERYAEEEVKRWYSCSIAQLQSLEKEGKLALQMIRETCFDIVMLDACLFSSKQVFSAVLDRTNCFILNDVCAYKNTFNHQALSTMADWSLLRQDLNDNNGWSIFVRNSCTGKVRASVLSVSSADAQAFAHGEEHAKCAGIDTRRDILGKFAPACHVPIRHYRQMVERQHVPSSPITLYPDSGKSIGRVLFSYLAEPVLFDDNDERLKAHSNKWESREIARIFLRMGYIVDAILYRDDDFVPTEKYDIVFDIHYKIERLKEYFSPDTIKILHMTGGYPRFAHRAEQERISAMQVRRPGAAYLPKRAIDERGMREFDCSIEKASFCTLIGNKVTIDTYPAAFRGKTALVTVTGSVLARIKSREEYVPPERQFLWFFGAGAVMKGLDLLLDVFSRNPQWTLNVVGNVKSEVDFLHIYRNELLGMPNIKYHGFLIPSGDKFQEILDRSFCFIAPASSEAISTAVVTCMQAGLFPIVSRNTGIDLPAGCGIYLETCTDDEITRSVTRVLAMDSQHLASQIAQTQRYACTYFSRPLFTKRMTKYLRQGILAQQTKRSAEHL